MTPQEMTAALAALDCRAVPIIPDGWTTPNGYELRGPRGNRSVVAVNADGNPDAFAVRLWLEGIAYGNARCVIRARSK